MRKAILLLLLISLLLLCGVCFGATLYVATDGNDGTASAGNISLPWKKIQIAIDAASNGDTIALRAGTYNEASQGATILTQFLTAGEDNKTLIVKAYNNEAAIIDYSESDAAYCIYNTAANSVVTFQDLVFIVGRQRFARLNSSTATFIFDNCTGGDLNVSTGNSYFDCQDQTKLWLKNGCDFQSQYGTIGIVVVADFVDGIYIDDSVLKMTKDIANSRGIASTSGFTIPYLRVKDSTLYGGRSAIKIDEGLSKWYLSGNDMRTLYATSDAVIQLGIEYADVSAWADTGGTYSVGDIVKNDGLVYQCITEHIPTGVANDEPGVGSEAQKYWEVYSMGTGIIEANNVLTAVAGTAHCIFTGFGVNNATIVKNRVADGNFQIVCKGFGNLIENNITTGANGISVFAYADNRVLNNTIVCTSGSGIIFGVQDGAYASRSVAYNNIVVLNGGDFCMSDQGDNQDRDNYVNYNCYFVQSGTGMVRLNGVTYDSLSTLQTQWNTQSKLYYEENDLNSLNVNPQLDANYRSTNSLVINGGKPDANGNSTSIGAIPDSGGVSSGVFYNGFFK